MKVKLFVLRIPCMSEADDRRAKPEHFETLINEFLAHPGRRVVDIKQSSAPYENGAGEGVETMISIWYEDAA